MKAKVLSDEKHMVGGTPTRTITLALTVNITVTVFKPDGEQAEVHIDEEMDSDERPGDGGHIGYVRVVNGKVTPIPANEPPGFLQGAHEWDICREPDDSTSFGILACHAITEALAGERAN